MPLRGCRDGPEAGDAGDVVDVDVNVVPTTRGDSRDRGGDCESACPCCRCRCRRCVEGPACALGGRAAPEPGSCSVGTAPPAPPPPPSPRDPSRSPTSSSSSSSCRAAVLLAIVCSQMRPALFLGPGWASWLLLAFGCRRKRRACVGNRISTWSACRRAVRAGDATRDAQRATRQFNCHAGRDARARRLSHVCVAVAVADAAAFAARRFTSSFS